MKKKLKTYKKWNFPCIFPHMTIHCIYFKMNVEKKHCFVYVHLLGTWIEKSVFLISCNEHTQFCGTIRRLWTTSVGRRRKRFLKCVQEFICLFARPVHFFTFSMSFTSPQQMGKRNINGMTTKNDFISLHLRSHLVKTENSHVNYLRIQMIEKAAFDPQSLAENACIN